MSEEELQGGNPLPIPEMSQERKDLILRRMEAISSKLGSQTREFKIIEHAITKLVRDNNPFFATALMNAKRIPVSIQQFIQDDDFLANGRIMDIWPSLRTDIEMMNPDVWIGEKPVYEAYLGGATGCVDAETEFLTPTGWKRIDQYQDGDLVAQYNQYDGIASFVKPNKYVKAPCEKFMLIKSKYGVDQALTDGHRVLYKSPKTGKLHVKPAIEIKVAHEKSKHGFRGKFLTTFKMASDTSAPFSDDEIAVIVMMSADAHVVKSSGVAVVSLKKPRKIERAKRLLSSAGIAFTETTSSGYTRLRFAPPTTDKEYDWAWQCSHDQLQLICTELMYWDARYATHKQAYTCSKKTADFWQYAFSATGIRATVGIDKRDGRSDCYVVTVSDRLEVGIAKGAGDKIKIDYIPAKDGYCYCFEVPDTFLVLRRNGKVFITGNTGKTVCGTVTNLYQLYLCTCFNSPHALFNLNRFTTIVFMFQSTSFDIASRTIYKPFRSMFLDMKYTKKNVQYDKYKESVLILPEHNIECFVALPDVRSMVGQAIMSGILDEVNFYEVIEASKKNAGPRGEGGRYDQAEEVYSTISRRRASRFTTQGPSIGTLCVSSSTRYANDFLDRRIDNAISTNQGNVYWARHRQYDVQPASKYSGERFKLLIGTKDYGTMVVPNDAIEGRDYPMHGRIELVPIEYMNAFTNDPENALRDVIGIATEAITPFFTQRDKITDAMELGRKVQLKNWTTKDHYDLARDGMPVIDESKLPNDPMEPRFVHVDLSITGDECGIGIVKPTGYTRVVTQDDGTSEAMPVFDTEMALTIKPYSHLPLDIAAVRQFVMNLKYRYGINIVSVTYDGYMSRESIQLIQKAGISSSVQSVDRTMEPYMDFRRAIYQGRMALMPSDELQEQLNQLEHKVLKNKVDHPPKGKKDIADAVCGAFFAASRSRFIRADAHTIGMSAHRRPVARRRSVSNRPSITRR